MKRPIRISLLASLCALFCANAPLQPDIYDNSDATHWDGSARSENCATEGAAKQLANSDDSAESENCTTIEMQNAKLGLRTVVIDAGHGGKDPGCVSADKKTYEKTLTLDFALRLAEKIRANYPEVKVVLTRSRDEFVSLNARAEIANKANADLFISLHINSTTKSTPNGYSVHILGQSSSKKDLLAYNMDVCQRENSVILLEEDYSTKYQGFDPTDPESFIFMTLMQSAHLEQSLQFAQVVENKLKGGAIVADRGLWQNGFYVLWKTSMPSVLVELGFISNSADLTALRSKEKRADLTNRLFKAFCEYKAAYDASLSDDGLEASNDKSTDTKASERGHAEPVVKSDSAGITASGAHTSLSQNDKPVYASQIFAISRLIPEFSKEFMGYKPRVIKADKIYKYYIGVSENLEEAKAHWSKIKKQYPDAYLVRIEGENISRQK